MIDRFQKSNTSAGILANFSLTLLKALLVLAFLGMMLMSLEINRIKTTEGIKPPVFMLITASWPNEVDVDVDLHLKCPNGDNINYAVKEACFASLERDARGSISDSIITNNKKITHITNKEIASFRTPFTGEWIINVNWYAGTFRDPIPVKIEIILIEPNVKVVYETTVQLRGPKHEHHVVRFTVNDDKSITNLDSSRPTKLIGPSINNLQGIQP